MNPTVILVDHAITLTKALGINQISIGIISQQTELRRWYRKLDLAEGESKQFKQLPFVVTFMAYKQK
ncbi:MAG: hypothetical protein HKO68_16305 [Desulfobacterales bacterium]|nr:hypothetical protein [Desulfobacterales bacterium]